MNKPPLKQLRKSFTLQRDYADCGVACLLSLIRYYGGDDSLEHLRNTSGTNKTGTTLLGLSQAAQAGGLDASGCQADWESMAAHPDPLILHVYMNDYLQHYVVCYGRTEEAGEQKFIIGDPGKGLVLLSEAELRKLWKSGFCLILKPNERFEKRSNISKRKREWFEALIKEDRHLLIISVILGVLIAALGTTMMIFSQRLIDHILPDKDYKKLYISLALVFLLLAAREGATALRTHFLINQSKDFNLRIVDRFFSRLLRLPGTFFDTRKIGEFSARLTDTARIQKVISQLAGNTVIDALVAIVSLGFIFLYSWRVPVVCIILLPVYFLLIYRFNKTILAQQKDIMANYALAESNYISTFQGINPIKNYNKHELFTERNKTIYENYQNSVLQIGKTSIRLTFLANGSGVLFLILIVMICSWEVLTGKMQAGGLIAVIGMCTSLLTSVTNLALVAIPINEAKIAFNRMFEYTGIETEMETGTEVDVFHQLSVNQIAFRFPGRGELFHQVSFSVRKGEIIALMGENGSGKSTLGKIIQKKYTVNKGEILINGHIPLSEVSLPSWRRLIAVVEQNVHLFNGSVLDNIAFDEAARDPQKVIGFLQEFGFSTFIEKLPQSYLTIVGESGIELSGGQKQVIAFARALFHRPELLILDETNSALDREAEQFLLNLLLKIKEDKAIILITHRLHVLRSICDRILILEKGVISGHGSHSALLETENLYSRYWKDLGY